MRGRKMSKYKLSYIEDDDGVKREMVAHFMEDFDVVNIPLYENNTPLYKEVKELAEDVVNAKLDAVVIDYSFVDKTYDIKFTGADLVAELGNIMPYFPVFILSGKVDAERSVSDVNLVYVKKDYLANAKSLNTRIKLQIENYKKRLRDCESRLQVLIAKASKEALSIQEEEELISLDDFLEKSHCSTISVPASLKKSSNAEKLNKLIEDTETLIKDIEKK